MNQKEITQTTITLLRCFLTGERFEGDLPEELRKDVYDLAGKHDVAHLIGVVLERGGLLEKNDPFLAVKRQAIFRFAKQEYERERVYELLENAGISFVPLKGSVIGALYPEPWQRTGCDIDILVHEEELECAVHLFREKLNYALGSKSEHDISLMSPNGVHLELHYDLHEEEVPVDEVWACAHPICEGRNHMVLSNEAFLFHHVAHMAKHFKFGGCGLRPFIDLWILKDKMPVDAGLLQSRLEESGLSRFAEAVFGILDFWFGDGEHSPVIDAAANYILPAGAYGSVKNRVVVGQIRKGGKVNYFFSRLFLSREALEYPYPILKKHGWLLFFCQVHRWYKLLADGKLGRITQEMEANSTVEAGFKEDVGALLNELGL